MNIHCLCVLFRPQTEVFLYSDGMDVYNIKYK